HRLAVSRSDRPIAQLHYRASDDHKNTGGGDVWGVPEAGSQAVGTIAFDEIARSAGRCRFLKLDCEGSEHPTLYTSQEFSRVAEVAGEFRHVFDGRALAPELDVARPMRVEALCGHLEALGLRTEHHYVDGERLGLFFARWP